MRKMNNIGVILIRVVFALVYTLTILPFTVNFFKGIVDLVNNYTLANLIPLATIHDFTLPFFLMSLEFAAVGLACSFWAKRSTLQKIGILILFLCCQLFPMISLYYDVRGRDYLAEKAAFQTRKEMNISSISNRIHGIGIEINTISKDIQIINRRRHENSNFIDNMMIYRIQPVFNGFELSNDITNDIKSEIQQLKLSRDSAEKKINELYDKKKSLAANLSKWEDELHLAQSQSMKTRTKLEYITQGLYTSKSGFVALIALIFPLTILGLAFVLPKSSDDTKENDTLVLKDHLKYGFSLPVEAHLGYAKLLEPSLFAQLTTQVVSNSLANENLILHLQNKTSMQAIEKADLLKKEVLSSRLSGEAKQHLINKIDEIVLKNLNHMEEK